MKAQSSGSRNMAQSASTWAWQWRNHGPDGYQSGRHQTRGHIAPYL